ncbi:hypothetical protein QFC20_001124 [Naganishia adeliensis]|uniref:Uncharacterized protein n=1 Tax=Naganishia adeliensis TaxID=92952 RepID=A0ACC2WW43_9TREE|nr:hypothetical protein QFC20_001124 [Naganishia adeliensis]
MSIPSMVVVDGRYIIAGRDIRTASNSSGVPAPTVTLRARYGLRPTTTDGDGAAASSQSIDDNEGDQRPLSDYLVGHFLEDALSRDEGNTIEICWPFEESVGKGKGKPAGTTDWRGREAILQYLFSYQFGQPPRENVTSLILVPPPTRSFVNSNALLAKYTQLAFESLNCSTFAIMPWPVASLFGVGAVTGMVVHVGTYSTEIAVVIESTVRTDLAGCVDVGREDCVRHLSDLLSKEDVLQAQIAKRIGETSSTLTAGAVFRELAEAILDDEDRGKLVIPLATGSKAAVIGEDGEPEEEEGVLNVAKMAAAEKAANERAAQAAAEKAADVQTYRIASLDLEVKVGPVRHRACEPLYRALDGLGYGSSRTVQEGLTLVMKNLEPNYRQVVWESIVFTGDLARIPSLSYAITSHLNLFLLSNPDRETDEQPNHYRILRMPEYYPEFKNASTNVAPFLGASIAAKAILNGHAISKSDYNQHGPAAIYLAAALE